ncbi:response regulator [Natronosalvus rutilus]|uniref:Response regulator n=1 Tax=Natronosalvus rutilus TaxID=2953753 RepID=A0A9E7SWY0_9EURY|nr:response regulator [Natronosalvus rutilus]UTF55885.1 response regulator [Natronosalvus rutilus]
MIGIPSGHIAESRIVTNNVLQRDFRKYDVLLIEPDPGSVSRFIDSFEATEVTNNVTVVSTGNEALEFLNRKGDYSDAPRPDLVLLDLQLSGPSGTEILAELKNRPVLRQIPVLVLTTSDATEDIVQSYDLYANAYLQKPDSSDELDQLAQVIEDFWLRTVRLPPKEN